MGPYIVFYILVSITLLILMGFKFSLNKKNMYLSCCIFGMLAILMALRRDDMGVDLLGYLRGFTFMSNNSLVDVLTNGYMNYEHGYIIYNAVVGSICDNEQFFLSVCAVLTILPIGWVVGKLSANPFLSILVYMSLPAYHLAFSGLRQALAVTLCFVALYFLVCKKCRLFLIFVLLAATFHKSAIVFLLAYPLYKVPINSGWRMLSVAILPVVFLLKEPIFLQIGSLLQYDAEISDTGVSNLFMYFLVIYIFLAFCERSIKNIEFTGFLNIFFLACLIQLFGMVHMYATRLGYYFMMTLSILIPNAISGYYHNKLSSKVLLYCMAAVVFFILDLYFIYNSGYSGSYPYHFFWE